MVSLIKKIVKHLLCPVQCMKFRIKNRHGFIYIGKACKIVNSKNMEFGKDVSIMPYNMLLCHGYDSRMILGKGTEIGMYSRIAAQNIIRIGNDVLTGPHVFIADYNHEYRDVFKPVKIQGNLIKRNDKFPNGGISIGEGSWIGTNVVIVGTLEIGKHCVIGANSVVTTDIPDYCVAVGSPCKVVKRYNFDSKRWESVQQGDGK